MSDKIKEEAMFKVFAYRDIDSMGKGDWIYYPTDVTLSDDVILKMIREEGESDFGDHHLYQGREVKRIRNKKIIEAQFFLFGASLISIIQRDFDRMKKLYFHGIQAGFKHD